MFKDKADLLVAALRSGKYIQGGGYLEKKGDDGVVRHCCLGVASDIAVEAGVCERREDSYSDVTHFSSHTYECYDNNDSTEMTERILWSSALLPNSVRDYFGFMSDNGTLPPFAGDSLAELNDGVEDSAGYADQDGIIWLRKPWTFEQIADLIEQHWESL